MDTRIKPLCKSAHSPDFFITPQALGSRLGRADAPLLLDVRPAGRYQSSAQLLAGAQRCELEDVPTFAAAQKLVHPHRLIVAYCVYGHHVSADAVAALRVAGLPAQALAGGFEGGQDGVDDTADIALWRGHMPLRMAKRADWGVTGEQPSRWVTRARPKIDRIACPWLICRFVDPRAEFFYMPAAQVLDEAKCLGAVAFDIPGAPVTHVGELCSFDALLQGFALHVPALDVLGRIVRGADTDCLTLAPQSAGLLAMSLGLSQLHTDDHAMLEAALPLYDALYAFCSSAHEPHRWQPETMTGTLP